MDGPLAGIVDVVDAHHHLWDLSAVHYPWLMARGERRFFGDPTPIQKDYLVTDLLADAAGLPLSASVHVQVGVADEDVVAETRWLQSVADSTASRGLPQAIVAYCDLAREDAPETMRAHLQSRNLRGIRQIFGRAPHDPQQSRSDALIDDPCVAASLAQAAALGLSFDLQIIPEQAGRIARLLERLPTLQVALCHCGSPREQDRAGFAAWRDAVAQLAALPQVHCKLSGFGMFDPRWSASSIRPLIETCIALFGAGRCMFGSNFPVEKLARDYRSLWGAYAEVTRDLGPAARAGLFAANARRFYRIAA